MHLFESTDFFFGVVFQAKKIFSKDEYFDFISVLAIPTYVINMW